MGLIVTTAIRVLVAAVVPTVVVLGCSASPSPRMCVDDSDCTGGEVCGADRRCEAAEAGRPDSGGDDAGPMEIDAGPPREDAGEVDSGPPTDAGSIPDSGPMDGGSTDAGLTDAGSTDAGSTDAGSTDAGSTDAGSTDAGSIDAGSIDAGTDAGSPRCMWVDVPCATGAPIRNFCAGGRTVGQLRRCDGSLFTPPDSYLNYELCNCGCGMATCVAWSQVECCS